MLQLPVDIELMECVRVLMLNKYDHYQTSLY